MQFIVLFTVAAAAASLISLAAMAVRRRIRARKASLDYPEDAPWRYAVNVLLVAFFILFTISGVIAGGAVLIPTN